MSFLFIDLFDVPRMTEAKLKNLLAEFQSPQAIFNARMQDLLKVKGIDHEIANTIRDYQQGKETQEKYRRAEQLGIKIISYLDEDYPQNLKSISHAPPVLFMRGEITEQDQKALAVIGTRIPTTYGKMVAEKFAYELAQMGITIVSGLARGIDTAAHLGALKVKGRTIAVLGCGVDIYYPPENKSLYDQISQNGAVISEFNLGTMPFAMNFPKRNRIISGLSLGVLAVEAPVNSGVLNTVTWAADQGREVFAVPGAINQKSSMGTNQLIKDGVKPVTSVQDICQELDIAFEKKEKQDMPVTELEKQVLDLLSAEPLYPDEIVDKLKQPMSVLLPQLLALEIKGLIKQLPGNKYIKTF